MRLLPRVIWLLFAIACVLACQATEPAEQRSKDSLIAIDAGHGALDPGTTSARGVAEYDFNRRLADEVARGLREVGYRTLLVNADGSLTGTRGLEQRTQRANEVMADLFISIHHDSVQEQYLEEWSVEGSKKRFSDQFSGYSIFFSGDNIEAENSRSFAETLADSLLQHGARPSLHHAEDIDGERRELVDPERGIYRVNFWVVKQARMPAVLLEAGVIVNRAEEARMEQPEYRRLFVDSVVTAVDEWNRRR